VLSPSILNGLGGVVLVFSEFKGLPSIFLEASFHNLGNLLIVSDKKISALWGTYFDATYSTIA
jgi:hypothetical protein